MSVREGIELSVLAQYADLSVFTVADQRGEERGSATVLCAAEGEGPAAIIRTRWLRSDRLRLRHSVLDPDRTS